MHVHVQASCAVDWDAWCKTKKKMKRVLHELFVLVNIKKPRKNTEVAAKDKMSKRTYGILLSPCLCLLFFQVKWMSATKERGSNSDAELGLPAAVRPSLFQQCLQKYLTQQTQRFLSHTMN